MNGLSRGISASYLIFLLAKDPRRKSSGLFAFFENSDIFVQISQRDALGPIEPHTDLILITPLILDIAVVL